MACGWQARRAHAELTVACPCPCDWHAELMPSSRRAHAELTPSSPWPARAPTLWLAVDLNSIMYRQERSLQQLAVMAGDQPTASALGAAAVSRKRAMDEVMWNSARAQWVDVHHPTATQNNAPSAASNWLPLWAGAFDARQGAAAVASLRRSGLVQSGGVATTLTPSDQQWDWPNAWAPLQEMCAQCMRMRHARRACACARCMRMRMRVCVCVRMYM